MNEDIDRATFGDIPDPFAEASARVEPLLAPPAVRPPSPTRAHVRATRFAALAIAVLVDLVWPIFIERRPDLGHVAIERIALPIGVALTAAAIALGALGRAWGVVAGEPRARALSFVVAAPAWFAAITALSAPEGSDPAFWRHAAGCVGVTLVLALAPLALGLFAFRRAFVALAALRTAALGVVGGALACATMALVCPLGSATHLLVGHGAILVIAGGVGAALGRIGRA